MTDQAITDTLDYYRVSRGGAADMIAEHAAKDIRAMAVEIDRQREMNNHLADQSKRLRELSDRRGKVLEMIRDYASGNFLETDHRFSRHTLGTIVNMVQQQFDTEKAQ